MKKQTTLKERFVNYIRKTIMNKIVSLIMITIGIVMTYATDGDITVLLFMLAFGVPLFFINENQIEF